MLIFYVNFSSFLLHNVSQCGIIQHIQPHHIVLEIIMRLQTSKTKNAESFYIVESIYVDGKRSNKVVKRLGTLEQIIAKIGPDKDPYEWGREQARLLTEQQKEEKEERISIQYDPSMRIKPDSTQVFSSGYLFLQKIYCELGIPVICREISKEYKFEYDLDEIFSKLIYARALSPSSKKQTLEDTKNFLEPASFELHQIYRALEVLANENDRIQSEVYKSSKKICDRNDGVLYYDCTNYYFEIEEEDEFRKYGYSKEHRPNPIVQMGLFMDGNGIPLAFSITPGNTNEQTTLKPLEKKILKDFGLADFIVCTDAGLSSADNRMFNSIMNRSFITTQSLKTLKGFLKEWAVSPTGFHLQGHDEEFDVSKIDKKAHWNHVFWKEQWINENGIEQRLIVTFSPKYEQYEKHIREKQISRAAKMIDAGDSKISRRGQNDVRKYITSMSVTGDGEVAEKTVHSLNEKAILEAASYDGFYGACTNLEDEPEKIIKVMRGRWEIEECFRIMKSEFEARPVYLSREDRITAHFLTCFMALLLYRILEQRVHAKNENLTVSDILSALQEMKMFKKRDMFFPAYNRSGVTDVLHEVSGFCTDYEIIPVKKMRKIIKASKKA